MLRQMKRSGYEIVSERVETKEAMRLALAKQEWDAIIGDYSLPQFSAEGALETLKESGLDLPFILVSGTVGEETAVRMMKAGANDYLLKEKMERLGPAIERAFEEFLNRRERRKAEEELRRNQKQLSFLSKASGILGSSFDYEMTIHRAVREAIPDLCDFCIVDLIEADRTLKTLPIVHPSAEITKRFEAYRGRYPENPAIEYGYPQVIRTGKPQIIPILNDSIMASVAQDPEQLKNLRDLGIKSSLCVPLIARDLALGAVTFYMIESDRHFSEPDLWVAQEFASRVASAIDHSWLYREAQHAVKVRDEFLMIASHELKTPITSLKMNLQISRRGVNIEKNLVPSAADLAKSIDLSITQVNRLTKLIEDMMDVTRMEVGTLSIELGSVNLSTVIREVLDRFSAELASAKCSVEVSVAQEIVGHWDKARIEQVVINLVSNAIKYAAGTKIKITAQLKGAQVTLKIQDGGRGIAKDKQASIFERFERATFDRNIVGLGLGLFICRKIVEAHQGKIHVESEEGKGSTFIVDLPISGNPVNKKQGIAFT